MNSNAQHSIINVVDINTRDVNIIVEHLQNIQKQLNLSYEIEAVSPKDTVADTISSITKCMTNAEHLIRIIKEKIAEIE